MARQGEERRRGRLGGTAEGMITPARSGPGILARGAVAGLVGGVVFLLFEVQVAALAGRGWALPLRLMASIAAGQTALQPSFGIAGAVALGLIVMAILSLFWGILFAMVASAARIASPSSLALVGLLFGVLVWLIDFRIVALYAWPWLRETNSALQLIAHTFFFGLPLGWALAGMRASRRSGA